MQTEKNSSINPIPQNLFQDRYGILALAAHATLTKNLSVSKAGNDLRLRLMRWANSVLVTIKQLFWYNPISFFDFSVEPDALICCAIWKKYLKKKRKSHG